MSDPTTSNQLLFVPTRGSDPGTWDLPVNSNTTSVDGLFGGVQGISVSNASFSLTAPAGIVTPSAGPTQAQNAVLNFTGTLSAPVQVTLPLPGYYIIRNGTSGNFVLSFRAVGVGAVIGFPQGQIQHVFNDGTNVFFANLGNIGVYELWTGLSAMPAWVTACTNAPYLLLDGTVYNISSFPVLAGRYGTSFGGNGVTTFGVPDLRGRVPLHYDGTGARITAAVSGINGQTLGASADNQGVVLTIPQIPAHTHANTLTDPTHVHTGLSTPRISGQPVTSGSGSGGQGALPSGTVDPASTGITINNASVGGGLSHTNVQPAQVTGIAVVRAA